MIYGYARVSSIDQETDLQFDALNHHRVDVIYSEKCSSVGKRPQLQQCISLLKPGDCLVVYKLDRLARSLHDLLTILEGIQAVGAGFKSLTEPIDTTSPVGVFIVHVLGSVGQFERALIRERAIAGQVAAYQRGVRWGGQPRAVTSGQSAQILELRQSGQFTVKALASKFGCSESTVWRLLAVHKNHGSSKKRRLPVLSGYLASA